MNKEEKKDLTKEVVVAARESIRGFERGAEFALQQTNKVDLELSKSLFAINFGYIAGLGILLERVGGGLLEHESLIAFSVIIFGVLSIACGIKCMLELENFWSKQMDLNHASMSKFKPIHLQSIKSSQSDKALEDVISMYNQAVSYHEGNTRTATYQSSSTEKKMQIIFCVFGITAFIIFALLTLN